MVFYFCDRLKMIAWKHKYISLIVIAILCPKAVKLSYNVTFLAEFS